MRHIIAVYDGRQVVLLEPVDLPAGTPLDIVVLDDQAAEQHVQEALKEQGLIRTTEPPANRLVPTTPISVVGPPVSQTVIEDRR